MVHGWSRPDCRSSFVSNMWLPEYIEYIYIEYPLVYRYTSWILTALPYGIRHRIARFCNGRDLHDWLRAELSQPIVHQLNLLVIFISIPPFWFSMTWNRVLSAIRKKLLLKERKRIFNTLFIVSIKFVEVFERVKLSIQWKFLNESDNLKCWLGKFQFFDRLKLSMLKLRPSQFRRLRYLHRFPPGLAAT